ncbi:hypothetical protein EF900_19700, partial [Staphylococcus aureus]
EIEKKKYRLDKDSVILLEQIRTLDKKRLKEKLRGSQTCSYHSKRYW